ncbi:MAG: magnesium transporter [Candidatus Korarchaeum sp.]|nr:magnesium transporter [Candidatus Korarchaeum sp.]
MALMHNDSYSSSLSARKRFQIFKESMFSLSFDLGGLFAGSILEVFSSLALRQPWCIALYPIVLTGRGSLNGIEAARISTGLHLGTIRPNFRGNTTYYYSVIVSMIALSLLMSFLMGLLAFIFTGSSFKELPLILSTAISSQTIAIIVIVPATSFVGHEWFKRGLDPDAVVYPMTSTIADIWATLSYIISLTLAFSEVGVILIYLIASSTVIFTLTLTAVFIKEEEFRRTIRESFLTIVTVTSISSISGFSLSSVRELIERTPGILTVYPAIIDTIGDCAAIFGSTSTTNLFTGLLSPNIRELRSKVGEVAQVGAAGLIYFIIYSFISFLVGGLTSSLIIPISVYAVLLPLVIVFTFSLAILTFRRGLNPDNFIIPFETTVTDTLSTVIIAMMLVLMS